MADEIKAGDTAVFASQSIGSDPICGNAANGLATPENE
jgi:hypothetical protein